MHELTHGCTIAHACADLTKKLEKSGDDKGDKSNTLHQSVKMEVFKSRCEKATAAITNTLSLSLSDWRFFCMHCSLQFSFSDRLNYYSFTFFSDYVPDSEIWGL